MKLAILLGRLGGDGIGEVLTDEAIRRDGDARRHDLDLVVFYQDLTPTRYTLPFAAMNVAEAYDYRGVAVATSLATAECLLGCPGPAARYFYVWDLEWVGEKDRDFAGYHAIYASPRLTLIARSEEDRRLLEDCWNARVAGVVPDGSLDSLYNLMRTHDQA